MKLVDSGLRGRGHNARQVLRIREEGEDVRDRERNPISELKVVRHRKSELFASGLELSRRLMARQGVIDLEDRFYVDRLSTAHRGIVTPMANRALRGIVEVRSSAL